MPIAMIHFGRRREGKTSDALEWFFDQDSPKAYIMPSRRQLDNLPIDEIRGEYIFVSESQLNGMRGRSLKAIVIDEFDQFREPIQMMGQHVFIHVDAQIYICGTPRKDISPLIIFVAQLANHGYDIDSLCTFSSKEIRKAVVNTAKLLREVRCITL